MHTYLIADDLVLLLVVQGGNREAPLVIRVHIEVNISKMGKILVNGIWGHIFSRQLLVGLRKSPACRIHSAFKDY